MASEAHDDEYEEPVAEELLLTERLDDDTTRAQLRVDSSAEREELLLTERLDDDTTRAQLRVDSSAEREKPRDTDVVTGDEEGCEEEADSGGSESPHQGWNTARSSSAALMAESAQNSHSSSKAKLLPSESLRRRKLANGKEQQQVQSLTRKLSQYKKLNAELHHQLQIFYKNEAVAQLENKNKEKQLQIDQLFHENRMLTHQQRLLAKQIEELQDSKDNFPLKKYALQEELRICKERLRQYKEKQKDVDEKAFKMHQQAVDLATKNKALVERVKKLEAAAALSPSASSACLSVSSSYIRPCGGNNTTLLDTESIIASQEDEITRLQQRVALMKKTQRADRFKHERLLKANHDELEQTRTQLEVFYQQLFTKEKTIRSLFLQMKKLKRAVQDLSNAQQTNQHMQQMVFGREVRFPNHSPTHNHNHANQQHHRSSTSHHQLGHSNHTTTSSTPSLPFAATKKVTTDRIHDTLRQLGYIPAFTSSGKHLEMPKRDFGESLSGAGGGGNVGEDEEGEEELPPNLVQGKLIPMPPPSNLSRNAVRNGTPTSRNQFYSPSSRENSRREMLETALDIERDGGDPGQEDADGNGCGDALDDFGTRGFEESDLEDEDREELANQDGGEYEGVLQQSRSDEDEQEAVDDDELG